MKVCTLEFDGKLASMTFLVSQKSQAAVRIERMEHPVEHHVLFFLEGVMYGIYEKRKSPDGHYELLLANEIGRQVGFEVRHVAFNDIDYAYRNELDKFITSHMITS